ncbi:MAG: SDR family NAD(P)-dependent oxidoreductase [Pseudomonadota bacterium]
MDLGLKGKIAVVGGASQGIGYAIARLARRRGRPGRAGGAAQGPLDDAVRRIAEETGSRVLAIPADIRKAADCERIIDARSPTRRARHPGQ